MPKDNIERAIVRAMVGGEGSDFFFFSSSRRHTRCSRDWSSDVCSSDLGEILDGHLAHWERWGFGPWAVVLDETVIGWGGLRHTTVAGHPEVELLWFVHPDYWNRGYSTEIAREAVRVAFHVLELDNVVAFTVPVNRPSRAVMEKLGMTFERDIEHAGLPHVLYRLTAR